MSENFDIIIIGGSFAGMSSALAMADICDDLKVAIIEKQDILSEDRKRDGRAYAISSASLKFFKEVGIYDRLQKEAGKIADIKITDYKSPFILDFLGQQVDEKDGQLGQIIENYHIHNALRDQVVKRKNITVFSPNFYEEIEFLEGEDSCNRGGLANLLNADQKEGVFKENVKIKLDNSKTIKSKLLLACDGRFSPLRAKYEIETAQKKYGQTAIVFNIEHKEPHQNIAHEKFLPGGPLAILPMHDQHHSSIVWIAPDNLAKEIIALDEENFIHQLQKKMEGELGTVKIVSDKFSYPLILIEAQKFYHKKMLLIGDAACGVHPIAGQGFNLAIAGIVILQKIINRNLKCGLSFSSGAVIEEYHKKTKSGARKMLIATDILNSLFENKSFTISLMRDVGLGLVNKIPKLKNFFIKSAGGF